ncbi:MAG: aminoacyl-tRNA hydrolase [Clostridiales bacterium]|nr:aminoacyl-tRNA hydrolase [Clostridiales bacterium]
MGNIFELFKQISDEKETRTGAFDAILVGLGNPGKKYAGTRHNAGFMQIDALLQTHGVTNLRAKFNALCGEVTIRGIRTLVMKPQTYMNESGLAVAAAADYYQLPPEKIIVVFDDISLPPGAMRIRRSGSAGGHNGIKSIINCLGSEAFPRIKIGVGQKPHKDYDLADWVLSRFTDTELKKLAVVFKKGEEALALMLSGEIEKAMNLCNQITE